jgi:hypothetical protein
MLHHSFRLGSIGMLPACLLAQVSSFDVVPNSAAANDANSYVWLAGASQPLRQQDLIGQSQLTALIGHTITAIELRRTAAAEIYQGGATNLTVSMSISPNTPLQVSHVYSQNVGPSPTQVFSGVLTIPTSPPTAAAGPNPVAVGWTANNIVRIQLQTPFLYTGGTLCIDYTGLPIAGSEANWWMTDAIEDPIFGTTVDLGGGCGIYGGPNKRWAKVSEGSLVPGARANFYARGTPNGVGLAVIGAPSVVGLPLLPLGLADDPACHLHLASLDLIGVDVFTPEGIPSLLPSGSPATLRLAIPGTAAMFGITYATQWYDFAQRASSNAIRWTVASALPALDQAHVDGAATVGEGEAFVHIARVIRFEHQQ